MTDGRGEQELLGILGALCRITRGPAVAMIRKGTMLQEWMIAVSIAVDSSKESEGCSDAGQRVLLQDSCRAYGQLLWQLYLASAAPLPLQQSLSGNTCDMMPECFKTPELVMTWSCCLFHQMDRNDPSLGIHLNRRID